MNHTLQTDQVLRSNETLVAPDGSCYLIMQRDGNLCMYSGRPGQRGGCFWAALPASLPNNDYYAIMQGDGNLCVYQGKDREHRGAYVWGTGDHPQTGSRQFIAEINANNLTVSTNQQGSEHKLLWAARSLRVLTYNTHLMEGSNVAAGAWFAYKQPVIFHDGLRHQYIVSRILNSGADIVALQEVWSENRMHQICAELKHKYPYSALGNTGNDSLIADLYNYLDHDIPDRAAGSGVVLLSRYPLSDVEFHVFDRPTDKEELAASKGVLSAVATIDGKRVQINMTHAWTDAGGPSCSNIEDLVAHRDRNLPALFLGDFNIHRVRDTAQVNRMNIILKEAGAEDAWTLVHGNQHVETSYTDDTRSNNLGQFFSPDRNTEAGDCIDYVYVKNMKDTPTAAALRPFSATVLRDWKVNLDDKSRPDWYWVHEGDTKNMPSAATFGNKIIVAVRQHDDRLQLALFDRDAKTWVHSMVKDGGQELRIDGAPGIVLFNNCLHLFFQKNKQVYKMESTDGITWSAKDSQGKDFTSSGGVCPVVYQNTLFVFCRDPNGNQICYHKWSNRWSERKWTHIDTRHDISAAVLDNQLCIVSIDAGAKSPQGLMRALTRDGERWESAQMGDGITTSGPPGICVKNGRFHVFYREPNGGGIFHRSSADGIHWSAPDFDSGQATMDEVCPLADGDKITLFFSFVVKNATSLIDRVASYPDGALLYKPRALAHMSYPPGVVLDASDHYPYQVDIAWP